MAEIGIKTLLYLNEHNESVRFAGGASGTVLIGAGTTALPQWKTLADAGISATGHKHAGEDITSGTVAFARLPTGTGSSQVAIGNHTHAALSAGTGLTYGSSVTYNGSTARTLALNTEAEITWTNTHTFNALPKLNTSGVLIAKGSNNAITGLQATAVGHILQYKVVNGSGTYVFDHVPSTGVTDDAEYKLVGVVSVGGALKVPNVTGKVVSFNPSTGTLIATHFSGDGSNLTNLASQNLSGSIPSNLLPDLSGDYLPLAGGIMSGTISSAIFENSGWYIGLVNNKLASTKFRIKTNIGIVGTNLGDYCIRVRGYNVSDSSQTVDLYFYLSNTTDSNQGQTLTAARGYRNYGSLSLSSVKVYGQDTRNSNCLSLYITIPTSATLVLVADFISHDLAKQNIIDSSSVDYSVLNGWVIDNTTPTGTAATCLPITGLAIDHTHNYAGSTEPGGAPNSASVTSGEYYVLGVASANTDLKFTSTANKLVKFNGATGALTAPTFIGALTGNVTGDCTGSSGSCTGNAATATSATDATNASKLNVSASTSKLYLVGTTATSNGNVTIARDASVYMTGNTITATTFSGTATKANEWATGRTITLTGGVTGTSAAWTGSGNLSIETTLSSHNHAAGDINSGVFGVGRGGTGLSTYAKGDILYCSDDTGTDPVLSKLSIGSANQMLTVDPVNGVPAWDTVPIYFAVCDTAAATTAKVATSIGTRKLTSETLTAGTIAFVRFTTTNSGAVASLTLNIDGTGAKPIKQQLNTSATSDLSNKAQLIAGNTYMFQYNGTNWVSTFNYNNTYSEITDANLQSSTSSTAGLITGRRFVSALNALIADTLRLQITDSGSTAVNGTPVLAITGSETHWAALNVRERRYLKLNDSSSGITTSGAGYTISQTANSDLTVHMTIGNGATSNFSRYITLPSPSSLTEGDRIEFVITNLSSKVGTIWFDQGVSDASLYRSSQNYNYTQGERYFSTGEHVIADVITVGTGTTKVWRIVKHSELY